MNGYEQFRVKTIWREAVSMWDRVLPFIAHSLIDESSGVVKLFQAPWTPSSHPVIYIASLIPGKDDEIIKLLEEKLHASFSEIL